MITPPFVMWFPVLLKPELVDKKKPEKGYGYRVDALFAFPKSDPRLKEMSEAALELIYEKHGRDPNKWPAVVMPDGTVGKPGSALRSPFRDQAEKGANGESLPEGFVAGNVWMKFKTNDKYAVGIVDGTKGNAEVIAQAEVYSGRLAVASVTPKYYDRDGNRGVSFYLEHVQLLEHAKPLDGRARVSDVFKKVATPAGSGGAVNPFA